MPFQIVLAIVALLAGAIASIAGFGIGSILTPLLATSTGVKIAVAAVSIPHVVGTAVRFRALRRRDSGGAAPGSPEEPPVSWAA